MTTVNKVAVVAKAAVFQSILPLKNLQFFAGEGEDDDMLAMVKSMAASIETFKEENAKAMEAKSAEAEALKKEMETMKAELEAAKEAATKKDTAANRVKRSSHGLDLTPEQEVSRKKTFLKFARTGMVGLTPDERKELKDVGQKVKALVEDSTGEILVPEDIDTKIQTAKMDDVVMRTLARVLPTSSNRMKRTALTDTTAGWGKLETKKPTEGIDAFESDITPSESYIYVENLYGMTKIGEDELMDSDLNLEQYLLESFKRVFVREEGKAFLLGRGHNFEEPEGILENTDIKRIKTKEDVFTADDLLALQYAVHSAYRVNGVYIVDSQVELAARQLKDGNGNYIWQESTRDDKPAKLFGKPVYTQDDFEDAKGVRKGLAVFGDVKEGYLILDRVGMTIKRYDQSSDAMEHDIVPFRAKQRVGGGVADPKALAILEGKTGNEGTETP